MNASGFSFFILHRSCSSILTSQYYIRTATPCPYELNLRFGGIETRVAKSHVKGFRTATPVGS
jgi:hypothetical protein